MRSINQVTLLGRCGKPPTLNSKQSRLCFRLATTQRFKRDGSDSFDEQTDWHDIVVFGQATILFLSKNLDRGQPVFVQGRLRSFEVTQEQTTRRCWEVIADEVVPLPHASGHKPATPTEPEI